MPVAWMISTNATEVTVTFFLRTLKARNPVCPKWIMTDKDRSQINSLRTVYPEAKILLCWWHVLHAWQQHFVTAHYPTLWTLLKKWVRIQDSRQFDEQWEKIKEVAPASIVSYLEKEWLRDRDMWSAVTRIDRSVWELEDTNMLL